MDGVLVHHIATVVFFLRYIETQIHRLGVVVNIQAGHRHWLPSGVVGNDARLEVVSGHGTWPLSPQSWWLGSWFRVNVGCSLMKPFRLTWEFKSKWIVDEEQVLRGLHRFTDIFIGKSLCFWFEHIWIYMKSLYYFFYLQPAAAFRRPSSLLPVCRLQKAFVSKMALCKSRACIKAMLV